MFFSKCFYSLTKINELAIGWYFHFFIDVNFLLFKSLILFCFWDWWPCMPFYTALLSICLSIKEEQMNLFFSISRETTLLTLCNSGSQVITESKKDIFKSFKRIFWSWLWASTVFKTHFQNMGILLFL